MLEAQAIDRVHRIGQTKNVTITRYLVKDSVEMVRRYSNPCVRTVPYKIHANVYLQYVKWVQDNKLKLINQSLGFAEDAERFEKRKEEVKSYPPLPLTLKS